MLKIVFLLFVIAHIILGFLIFTAIKCYKQRVLPPEEKSLECLSKSDECYLDCKRLNLEFFKYDHSGIGSDECWCLKNNTPIQVW